MPVPPVDPEHAAKVAEAAKMALVFLRSRSPGVRCVTTRGTVIHTSAFAMEEDTEQVVLFTKLGEVESWFMSDILQVQ